MRWESGSEEAFLWGMAFGFLASFAIMGLVVLIAVAFKWAMA